MHPVAEQRRRKQAGLTLVELIVAFTILLLLTSMAVPLARNKVRREKERQLRVALHDIHAAIDKYKDMADKGQLGQLKADADGYPETLEVLVEGVKVTGAAAQAGAAGMGVGGMGMGGMGMGGQGGFGQPQSQSNSSSNSDSEKKIRFLRKLPKDPFTNSTNWGKRSTKDDPKSLSWGGQNVFSVYTTTMEKAADGTPYSEW